MHPHGVAEGVGVRRPDVLHQFLLAEPPPLAEHQLLQDGKLPGRQGKGLPPGGDLPGHGVQGQLPCQHQGRALDKLPAQQSAHPGLQLLQLEGLGQIVVRPQIQPGHLVRELRPGGEDQHPQLRPLPPDAAQQLQPLQARQVQIQDHQVIGLHKQPLVGVRAVIAAVHCIFFQLQILRDPVAQEALVLHHQNPHLLHRL